MDRTPNTWTVKLQAETGSVSEQKVTAHWDPNYTGIAHSVGHAAMAQARKEAGPIGFHVLEVKAA